MRSTVTLSGPCARDCPSGTFTVGAGEIIGRRADGSLVVVTARHVLDDSTSVEVFVRNDATPGEAFDALAHARAGHRATTIAYGANVDLALVAFDPTVLDDYAVAPMARPSDAVAPGVVVGAPNGSLWTASPYTFLQSEPSTFDFTCSTCGPGDSGGGVFDADGDLLGIVTLQRVADTAPNSRTSEFQAISLDELRLFLNVAGTKAMLSDATHSMLF